MIEGDLETSENLILNLKYCMHVVFMRKYATIKVKAWKKKENITYYLLV